MNWKEIEKEFDELRIPTGWNTKIKSFLRQKLEEQRREMIDAIQCLVDVQNGSPLIEYEEEWKEAMHKCDIVISKYSNDVKEGE